ncbi:MAG: hypothetical protein IJK58_09170 [Clostridia bacterium]|nr:hypothetical protein [Clostridia bacterium]
MNNELNWVKIIDEIDPELIENAEEDAPGLPASSVRRSSRRVKKLGRAVVIAAAVVLVLFSALMFNAEVRAAVLGFFIQQDDEGYTKVHFNATDLDKAVDVNDVSFGYIPEGYILHEIQEDPEQSELNTRSLRIIRAVYRDLPEIELANTPDDIIFINIYKSSDFDLGYGPGSFDKVLVSKINEKDAFIYYRYPQFSIMFGDGKITVDMIGTGFSLDEIIKIAENMAW